MAGKVQYMVYTLVVAASPRCDHHMVDACGVDIHQDFGLHHGSPKVLVVQYKVCQPAISLYLVL